MNPTHPLCLDNNQLIQSARLFCGKIRTGLQVNDEEIKCLPAYIPVTGTVAGRAIVLDLGGTRMRAALVDVDSRGMTFVKGPVEDILPLKRGKPLDKEMFLEAQVRIIKQLDPEQGLPLGYCFSYPSASEPDGDARLIHWTKGVVVPGMEGEKVGAALLDALGKQGVSCSRCVVLNDTTAGLMAGISKAKADVYIGLVVGTGTNMATLFQTSAVPKLDPALFPYTFLPVNLESGNYSPPILTKWDDRVDRESENPGRQRFEKAVSGAYLARILKAMMPDEKIDVEKGSAFLSMLCNSELPDSIKKETACAILTRSAKLVASSLAGLLLFQQELNPVASAMIVAEGGLIHKAPGYKKTVTETLSHLIQALSLPEIQIELTGIPHANLIGSAWAALS